MPGQSECTRTGESFRKESCLDGSMEYAIERDKYQFVRINEWLIDEFAVNGRIESLNELLTQSHQEVAQHKKELE